MVFSTYIKRRILFHHANGYHAPTITDKLRDEGIVVSQKGVSNFLLQVEQTCSTTRHPGSGRPSKQTEHIWKTIESTMRADDETTVKQLHEQLISQGASLSKSTVLGCRQSLGWTVRGNGYCQMIHEVNKVKCLEWATKYLPEAKKGFLDIIFTDKTSIQMESHRRFYCRKKGEAPRNKPRYSSVQEKLNYRTVPMVQRACNKQQAKIKRTARGQRTNHKQTSNKPQTTTSILRANVETTVNES